MTKDMTKGSPLRHILAFFFPLAIGNLFQQFYNMADTIIVGKYVGVDALAAVGSTGSLSFLVIGFVLGICSGFSIPLAQHFGAGDMKKMRHCLANAIYLSVIITVVLTTVVLLSTRWILTITKTPQNIFEDAYHYIFVIFAGIFATMFYNLQAGILRAVGDSRTPLYFLIIASILNVVLDLIFIINFSMGAPGAAYATVISQVVSGVLCLIYIRKKFPLLHIQKEERGVDGKLMMHLCGSGFPMALQFSITAVGTIIVQAAVNTFGSGVVAAITAANKAQLLVTQPMETLGITMATYCGQNLGAEKISRVQEGMRKSLLLSVGYCIFAWGVMSLFGSTICLLFVDRAETEILGYAATFLNINSIFFPFLGVLFVLRNALQGLGCALPAMTAGIFELIGRIVVAFFFVDIWHYGAICMANPVAWIAANVLLIPAYIYAMRGLRQRYPLEPK